MSENQKQPLNNMEALAVWYNSSKRAMIELSFDLTPRQISVLLKVYLHDGPHTVKNLAQELEISKAAVCRALDKLSIAKLVKRKKDESDRRNIFVQRTMNGSVFLSDFSDIILQSIESLDGSDKKKSAKQSQTA